MDVKANGDRSWTEYFRVITPFLLVVLNGFGFLLYGKITDMDEKLFKHLTNDEIHCPRSIMVTKEQVELITKMRDQQISDIKNVIKDQMEQVRIEIRNPQVYKIRE
jgi:hypothetical protein